MEFYKKIHSLWGGGGINLEEYCVCLIQFPTNFQHACESENIVIFKGKMNSHVLLLVNIK